MICPNCGAKIEDDKLYCGNCGCEINFVPEFEPVIEQSISDTLSEIKLPGEEYGNDGYFDDDNYNNYDSTDSDDLEYLDDELEEYSDEEYYEDEYYEEEYEEELYDEEEYYEDEYYDENEYYEDEYLDDSYYDEEYDEFDEFDEEFSGDPFDDFEYESHILKNFFNYIKNSKLKWFYLIAFVAIIVSITIFTIKGINNYKENHSSSVQYEKALQCASEGNYAEAIKYLEKCLKLDSSDSSKKYLLADYYLKNGEDDNALLMLWEIINENDVNSPDAYRKMIQYYAGKEDYAQIENILAECKIESIKLEFQEYLAEVPQFSEDEGTYDDVVVLKLSSNSNGKIYYTLDGSMPTYESDIYTTPIIFDELGQHTVTAFFVNSYGIESEIAKKTYLIDIVNPNPPNVLLDAGTYDTPQLIEVDVQRYCTVYYTTDGSAPNLTSNEYTGPIYMPIGQSHFIFIAYSQENIPGDITEVDYNLNIKTDVDVNDITSKLWIYDALMGKTGDWVGHMPSSLTQFTYTVTSAVTFNKNGELFYLDHDDEGQESISDTEKAKEINKSNVDIFYIFTEQLVDTYGNTTKTGTIFLVSVEDGTIYKASKNEEGIIVKGDAMRPEEYTAPVAPPVSVSENEIPEIAE